MSERTFASPLPTLSGLGNGSDGPVHASPRDPGEEPEEGSSLGRRLALAWTGGDPDDHHRVPHEGKLGRIIAFADTTKFWVIIAALLIVFVFFYAFSNNRSAVSRNSANLKANQVLVRQQRQALVYLCETVRLLDFGYVQEAAIARESANDPTVPAAWRIRWRQRAQVFTGIHQELSDTRACSKIE